MNRKQKIIVSVVGITIVFLALLGLTYAYYLTRIQGNTNTNSISITTANLAIKYSDNDSYINLTNIMPGTTTNGEGDNPDPKIFTVTNQGSNDVEYSVGMDEVTNTLTRTYDLTYSITCQEKLITADDTAYTDCATTSSNSGEYPKINSYLFTNIIKKDYTQKYTVVISYANPDEDQSIDMGSTIKGRMQIYSISETVDLTGTVTGVSDGDYVQINSEPKTSRIINGVYKLIGVPSGTHTLSIIDSDGVVQGTKSISILPSSTGSIDSENNQINFTSDDRYVNLNLEKTSTSIDIEINKVSSLTNSFNTDYYIKLTDYDSAYDREIEDLDFDSTEEKSYDENGFDEYTGLPLPYVVNEEDNTIEISNAGQFYYFAYEVSKGNTFKGITIRLMADITLDGIISIPVGANLSTPFEGTFDGNEHIIYGFYTSSSSNFSGVFGVIGESGIVKNVGVRDSYIEPYNYSGILVGINYGTISNSYATGGTIEGNNYLGTFAGANYGTITNSYVNDETKINDVLSTQCVGIGNSIVDTSTE